MVDRAALAAREGAWTLHSASDAAHELVRLVEQLEIEGWRWSPAPTSVHDLRASEDTEPVPIVLPNGKVLGAIRCPVRPTGDPTDAALRALLQTTVLAVAMERRGFAAVDRAAAAERQSRMDPLTGLPNRRLWDEVLAQEEARCARTGQRALVAIVDLDDLKATNDTFGHLAGDVLLRVTAQALRRAVRETDMVARLGGDEFGVLAVDFQNGDGNLFLDRVQSRLAEADVAASVGVAVAQPDQPFTDAVIQADAAMYLAKRAHKDHRTTT